MTPEQSAEIDGYYYDLPFDAQGNPVDPSRTPPDMPPNPAGQRRRYNPQTGAFE